jgi:hypothetical protein
LHTLKVAAIIPMFALTPFDVLAGFGTRDRVYVVSDSQYSDYKKQQALEHIRVLEARAEDYKRNLDIINATVTELKQNNNLLPAAKEEDTAAP